MRKEYILFLFGDVSSIMRWCRVIHLTAVCFVGVKMRGNGGMSCARSPDFHPPTTRKLTTLMMTHPSTKRAKLANDTDNNKHDFSVLLPDEVLCVVFLKLGARALCNCEQVCHRWREILKKVRNTNKHAHAHLHALTRVRLYTRKKAHTHNTHTHTHRTTHTHTHT